MNSIRNKLTENIKQIIFKNLEIVIKHKKRVSVVIQEITIKQHYHISTTKLIMTLKKYIQC